MTEKVYIEKDVVTDHVEVYIVREEAIGARFSLRAGVQSLRTGGERVIASWYEVARDERPQPYLRLPTPIWEEFVRAVLAEPRAAAEEPVARHRDDAIEVRDRLLSMIEAEFMTRVPS